MHIVGGGIASMAAAAFMIRDGDVLGTNITIYEQSDKLGGSLDGAGNAEHGYTLRGGRMLESKYLCTFGLFESIPTLNGNQSVTAETLAWNRTMQTSSKSRLVRNGVRETAPKFGLSERHILAIERLVLSPESHLARDTIAEQFDTAFFRTDFWFMWCTTFAFQPWHSAVELKRYLVRFAHMVDGFNRLEGIMRTVYNQFDSMVRPLQAWLQQRGVEFKLSTNVTDIEAIDLDGLNIVSSLTIEQSGKQTRTMISPADAVIVTLGSMTEDSALGGMDAAPVVSRNDGGGSWRFWKAIATGRPEFGTPSVFADHVDESKWVSFTITLRDPALLTVIRDITGNVPGEGGLITFPDSAWLVSIVIPYQPHFIEQPVGVSVVWGYGLTVDVPGNFVKKPLAECTGREIMTELFGHLRLVSGGDAILASSICIPCMMPYITSQFLPRASGDRPAVLPVGWRNLAFIGQYCELPEDVVFTVEYSIRSAQTAVCGLLGVSNNAPAVYKGRRDPRVLYKAFMALHDMTAGLG